MKNVYFKRAWESYLSSEISPSHKCVFNILTIHIHLIQKVLKSFHICIYIYIYIYIYIWYIIYNIFVSYILLRLNPFDLSIDKERWCFEQSVSKLRVWLLIEGAKNVSRPWKLYKNVSPLYDMLLRWIPVGKLLVLLLI